MKYLLLGLCLFGLSMPCLGQGKAAKKKAGKPDRSEVRKPAKKAKQQVSNDQEDDPLEDTSTSFDFAETLLEGKFKAPSGMVLKGRVQQSKSQMVQLRKHFRPDLRKSRSAVKAIRPRN